MGILPPRIPHSSEPGEDMSITGTRSNSGEAGKETAFLLDEIQLLLAEKRTSLSVLRTGIAVFALPLSVLSILITTSRYYDPAKVMHFLAPVIALSAALIILGTYLVARALRKLHAQDRLIAQLKLKSKAIATLMQ
ncbi:MAG: hypothetical protein AB1696_27575 [Planctomycetota bacterium]